VLLWKDRDDADDRAAKSEAVVDASLDAEKAARDAVTRMTTYDFTTVDDDFSWVDDAGTDKFQKNFTEATKAAITYIKSVKASAEGTVVDSAATAADADHVKVLLYVDQRIHSQGTKGNDLDQPRITMQMVRQDDEWLVDEVDVVNVLEGSGNG
jgi:Mce-associated membrane protein